MNLSELYRKFGVEETTGPAGFLEILEEKKNRVLLKLNNVFDNPEKESQLNQELAEIEAAEALIRDGGLSSREAGLLNDETDEKKSDPGSQNEDDMIQKSIQEYNSGNHLKATDILLPLATEGHPYAQYILGWIYKYSSQLNDKNKYQFWIQKAYEQGVREAKLELAKDGNRQLTVELAEEGEESCIRSLSCIDRGEKLLSDMGTWERRLDLVYQFPYASKEYEPYLKSNISAGPLTEVTDIARFRVFQELLTTCEALFSYLAPYKKILEKQDLFQAQMAEKMLDRGYELYLKLIFYFSTDRAIDRIERYLKVEDKPAEILENMKISVGVIRAAIQPGSEIQQKIGANLGKDLMMFCRAASLGADFEAGYERMKKLRELSGSLISRKSCVDVWMELLKELSHSGFADEEFYKYGKERITSLLEAEGMSASVQSYLDQLKDVEKCSAVQKRKKEMKETRSKDSLRITGSVMWMIVFLGTFVVISSRVLDFTRTGMMISLLMFGTTSVGTMSYVIPMLPLIVLGCSHLEDQGRKYGGLTAVLAGIAAGAVFIALLYREAWVSKLFAELFKGAVYGTMMYFPISLLVSFWGKYHKRAVTVLTIGLFIGFCVLGHIA